MGLGERTVKRARLALAVEAFRPTVPGPWFWRLAATATTGYADASGGTPWQACFAK
jgi:hypothetical protein